jgi:hypothetical protein
MHVCVLSNDVDDHDDDDVADKKYNFRPENLDKRVSELT